MREMTVTLAIAALVLLGVVRVGAQECDPLHDSTSDELVSYLRGTVPNQESGECVTFAINNLGKRRYEPAVPVLTSLLSFRRPLNKREKEGLYVHIQAIDEIYPAATALEEIGSKALPAVMDLIKENSGPTARENAVFVWMEIHKHESPKAVALLKREADKADDANAKMNLSWAVSKALTWCNPPDEAKCKAAAQAGRSD
jgi:hypothetical protein